MIERILSPLLFAAVCAGQTFVPPSGACWKVHCNAYENDAGAVTPPLANVNLISEDPTGGSGSQVSCVTNGALFACNIRGGKGYTGPYLRVYNADGVPLWDSGNLLGSRTNTPMIGADGGVIDADDQHIIRFGPPPAACCTAPTPVWSTTLGVTGHGSNGAILTSNGMLTLITFNGPVMTFDATTGKQIGTLWLDASANPPSSGTWYGTSNSACAQDNRIYAVTSQVGAKGSNPDPHLGILYGLDILTQSPGIQIGARHHFRGPSQASPMCSPAPDNGIFTDFGNGSKTPGVLGVTDEGSKFQVRYSQPSALITGNKAKPPSMGANYAWDPGYGCLWVRFKKTPVMYCLSPSAPGAIVTSIDISSFYGLAGTYPQSDATMTQDPSGHNIMLLGTAGVTKNMIAIDTTDKQLLWSYTIPTDAQGQFPIATNAMGIPRVGFTDTSDGTYFVGTPTGAALSQADLYFAGQATGTASPPQTLTLTNTSNAPIQISSVTASGDFSQTNDCPAALQPTATCNIQVTFLPAAAGIRRGAVTVTDDATNSPQTAMLTGSGIGPGVTLSTNAIDFHKHPVGTTSGHRLISVKNSGNAILTISAVAATGEFIETNDCANLAPGQTCKVHVAFAPANKGLQAGTVSITDNAPGSPQVVKLTGQGTN